MLAEQLSMGLEQVHKGAKWRKPGKEDRPT
jgi:hypothetical protein